MSAVKAILLVVVDIEDGGSTRSLVPRQVRKVPVVTPSGRSGDLRAP